MADLSDLIDPASVAVGVGATGKKQVLTAVAGLIARANRLSAAEVAARLVAREKLGSTGFGGGVAIPHARIDGLAKIAGGFARLDTPADFNAVDSLPVDLVFVLLSPVDAGADHLKALARVSRRLRDPEFLAKLRGAVSADALYALLAGVEARDAA